MNCAYAQLQVIVLFIWQGHFRSVIHLLLVLGHKSGVNLSGGRGKNGFLCDEVLVKRQLSLPCKV